MVCFADYRAPSYDIQYVSDGAFALGRWFRYRGFDVLMEENEIKAVQRTDIDSLPKMGIKDLHETYETEKSLRQRFSVFFFFSRAFVSRYDLNSCIYGYADNNLIVVTNDSTKLVLKTLPNGFAFIKYTGDLTLSSSLSNDKFELIRSCFTRTLGMLYSESLEGS